MASSTNFTEWTRPTPPIRPSITANMARHTHKTARSEALYAMLVEGSGPLGSYFSQRRLHPQGSQGHRRRRPARSSSTPGASRSSSTDGRSISAPTPAARRRAPLHHPSGRTSRRASIPTTSSPAATSPRPATRTPSTPTSNSWPRPGSRASPSARSDSRPGAWHQRPAVPALFFSLVDPQSASGPGLWDRSGLYRRRAYNSKPLIVSSGPDKLLGVAQFTDPQVQSMGAAGLVQIENQAARADPIRSRAPPANRNTTFFESPSRVSTNTLTIIDQGQDDLTNHGSATTGAIR